MNSFEITDPVKIKEWNDQLLAFSDANIFHTTNWAKVLYGSYGYKTLSFVLKDKNAFKFILPVTEVNSFITGKKGVSMAFSDYCKPLISKDADDPLVFQKIILASKQFKWKSIELRGESNLINQSSFFSKYYDHNLFLDDSYETIALNFRKNYLAKIKKAKNSNLKIEINNGENVIEDYYKLHCLTRKRQGMIPQPLYFFKSIFQNIIKEKMGFVIIIKKNDLPISGAVFFLFNKKLIYKFGASNLLYKDYFANFLLFDEAIKWALERSFTEFSFGRTEFGNEGLLQFKSGWGALASLIHYYKYDLKNDQVVHSGNFISNFTGKNYLKKLPVPLLRLAGNILYKHVG